ncbi:MAG: hypothetical protein AMS14_00380 [Planctomycetes bacterium DG_20]|nr:MAG: hypothetical protein AMS14_00380 [Planctomycetes bacterium DG_20]
MRFGRPLAFALRAIVPIGGVLAIVLIVVPLLLRSAHTGSLPWICLLIVLLFCANYLATRWWVRFVARKIDEHDK